jgi:hypothetical protein
MPPLEEVWDLLLYSVLPSAGLAVLVFALVRGILGKWAARAAAVLALLGGFISANIFAKQLDWLPGLSGWTWIFAGLVLVVLVEIVATLPFVQRAVTILLRLVCAGLVAWLLAPTDPVWAAPAFGLAVFAGWQLLDMRLRDLPPGLGPLILAIFCGGATIVLLHGDSLRFMTTEAILAAGLLGVAVGALLFREDCCSVAGPIVYLTLASLLSAWTQSVDSKVPVASFYLVGLAPLGAALTYLPPVGAWTGWWRGLALAVVLLVPVLIAVILAVIYAPLQFE